MTEDTTPPTVDVGPDQELTCSATSVTLDASVSGGTGPYTYSWSPGGETTEDIIVSSPGTHVLTATGANGCTASDSVTVTEDTIPPSVDAGPDQELTCSATSVTLDAGVSGGTGPYTYSWSPGGETTEDITVSSPGTYVLTATGANGCVGSDSVVISDGSSVDRDCDGLLDSDDPCPSDPDCDGDGVLDGDDDCPFIRGVASNDGCPPGDSDHDGLPDDDDPCPSDPDCDDDGLVDGLDPCPLDPDCDDDGIVDPDDECPTIAGIPSNDGCPEGDSDQDGLPDDDDPCPTIRDCDGDDLVDGLDPCPQDPDCDDDGLNDRQDRCPLVPGPRSNSGCPDAALTDAVLLGEIEDPLSDWVSSTAPSIYMDIVLSRIFLLPGRNLLFEMTVRGSIPAVPENEMMFGWLLDTDRNSSTGNPFNSIGTDYQVHVKFVPEDGWQAFVINISSGEAEGLDEFSVDGSVVTAVMPISAVGVLDLFYWICFDQLGVASYSDIAPNEEVVESELP